MSDEIVRHRLEEKVAVIEMDDGKVNAISRSMIDALDRALDRAEKEAKAIVLCGRTGRFSGGFDLGAMRGGMGERGGVGTVDFYVRGGVCRLFSGCGIRRAAIHGPPCLSVLCPIGPDEPAW